MYAKLIDFQLIPLRQPLSIAGRDTKGAKVTHKGSRWVSTADNNVWEPGAYGDWLC